MPKKCCMNCEYFRAEYDVSFCTIDKEIVPEPLEQIKFCPAFRLWWGAVEEEVKEIKDEKQIKAKTKKQEEMKELQIQVDNLQNQFNDLNKEVKGLKEQLKVQQFNNLKTPQQIQQVININNSQVNFGTPKRMKVQINYGMSDDEFNARKGNDFKGIIEDLKKDTWFLKRKEICEKNIEIFDDLEPI